jgi:hypothetical protein
MDLAPKDLSQIKGKLKAQKSSFTKKRASLPINLKLIKSQECLNSGTGVTSRRTRRKLNNLGDAIQKLKMMFDNTKNKFVMVEDRSLVDTTNTYNKNKENMELPHPTSTNKLEPTHTSYRTFAHEVFGFKPKNSKSMAILKTNRPLQAPPDTHPSNLSTTVPTGYQALNFTGNRSRSPRAKGLLNNSLTLTHNTTRERCMDKSFSARLLEVKNCEAKVVNGGVLGVPHGLGRGWGGLSQKVCNNLVRGGLGQSALINTKRTGGRKNLGERKFGAGDTEKGDVGGAVKKCRKSRLKSSRAKVVGCKKENGEKLS